MGTDEQDFTQDATAVLEQPTIQNFTAVASDVGAINVPEVVKETKEGYKTTEFWATVASAISVATGLVPTPHDTKGYALVVLVALYALARGLAKKGVPSITPVEALPDPAADAPSVEEPVA